jgi:hypothetical protein
MPSTIWSGTTTFEATAGQEKVVAVPMPHRAILKGYSLVTTDGSAPNFNAALYTSKQDTPPNSTLPAAAFLLYSFTQIDPADNDMNVSYLNRDGTPTNPQRYLYLKVTPNATKTFVFSVTVDTPSLR